MACGTVGKAAWTASPIVLKRTPSWAETASSSSAKWRSTAARVACRSVSQRLVLPSTSVKRKATVPLGYSGMAHSGSEPGDAGFTGRALILDCVAQLVVPVAPHDIHDC